MGNGIATRARAALTGWGPVGITVNEIVAVGTTALAWAFRERLIPTNPAERPGSFSGEKK